MPRGRLCGVCQEMRPTIDGIRSVAYFQGAVRDAIHRFKYSGVRALAAPLAQLLIEYQRRNQLPADVVVPVPLHPDRQTERGYNQSTLLAQVLAQQLGLPVREGSLWRARATAPQVTLDAQKRKTNVAGAFRARPADLASTSVLVIDDVCTTGATMDACAVALKAEGAQSVWGLALARSR